MIAVTHAPALAYHRTMTSERGDSPSFTSASSTSTPEDSVIAEFIRLDLISATLALVMVVTVNAVFVREPLVYVIVPTVAVLALCLLSARRRLAAGASAQALFLIATGNWLVSVAVAVLLPWLLPVMVLTILMPVVLGATLRQPRPLTFLIVGAAITLTIVVVAGISNDDGGIISDVDDAFELVVVLVGCLGHIPAFGLIVRQASERQRQTTDEAVNLAAMLRSSRRRLVESADSERRRIERDLHDGAQQRLVATAMSLRMVQPDQPLDRAMRDELVAEVEGAMADIRTLTHGLSPPLLEVSGLVAAITAATRSVKAPVELDIAGVGRYERSIETSLYFVTTEALQNAAKHAPGRPIEIRLTDLGDSLELSIRDHGPGFVPSTQEQGVGLVNMADRIGSIGGELTFDTTPGSGTTVSARVVNPQRAEAQRS